MYTSEKHYQRVFRWDGDEGDIATEIVTSLQTISDVIS